MMLAGFEAPTSEVIRIAGRSVHHLPPRRRGIRTSRRELIRGRTPATSPPFGVNLLPMTRAVDILIDDATARLPSGGLVLLGDPRNRPGPHRHERRALPPPAPHRTG